MTVPLLVVTYRGVLASLAHEARLDPAAVAALATFDDSGSRAVARLRHQAAYLLATRLDVPGATLASVVGASKQAIHKALRGVEDDRDDPAVDRLLDRVAAYIVGGV